MLTDLFHSPQEKKGMLILRLLNHKSLRPHRQYFSCNGIKHCNIWVHFKGRIERSIIVSSHYDGSGAYDNAGGVVALLYLIELFVNHSPRHNIIFCFFDCEEKGQLGSKVFLKRFHQRESIAQFLEIDGSGIGDCLVGIANFTQLPVRIGVRTVIVPSSGDFFSFISMGIPSMHLFSLPKKEGKLFVRQRLYPQTFSILHTKADNLEIVDDNVNRKVASQLCKIIRDLDSSDTYIESCNLLYFPFQKGQNKK